MAKKPTLKVAPEVEAAFPGFTKDAERVIDEAVADQAASFKSQSELSPNARWISERLNDILYRVHNEKFTDNEVNKLRTQIENSVLVK